MISRNIFSSWFVSLLLITSQAVASGSYVPPATGGGGVEGDGTGITDASAFRGALSLGTASVVNTGIVMGTVPVLGIGATLPAINGSLLTNITTSQISGLTTSSWDWARGPGSGEDELDGIVIANWEDAGGDFGGAVNNCVSLVASELLRVDNALDSDCATPLAGNRVTGVLRDAPSGDFVRFFRLGLRRSVAMDAIASYVQAGVVFVDGADSGAAWYSTMVHWAAPDVQLNLYTYSDTTTTAGNWESSGTGVSLGIHYALASTWDFAIERVGTTLNLYIAPAGQRLALAHVYTSVGTGTGKVGIRTETLSGTADDVSALLYAYRSSLTVVP